MDSGDPPPTCHPNTLLDLPDEVLQACMRKLADMDSTQHCSERACLAVCRQLLKLILTHHKRRLTLWLGPPEEDYATRKSLLCLYKAFPELTCLKVDLSQGLEVKRLADLFAHPDGDSASRTTGWLANISDICIQGGVWQGCDAPRGLPSLPQLVPDSFLIACPNLRTLRLADLHIAPQHAPCIDAPVAGMQQLCLHASSQPTRQVQQQQQQQQHAFSLQLHRLELQDIQYHIPAAVFQEQLAGLHSLQDLRMSELGLTMNSCDGAHFAAVANSVSQQLTVLHVNLCTVPQPAVTKLMYTKYALLQDLSIEHLTLDDTVMELLLKNMPLLQRLNFHVLRLNMDYSNRQCNWHKLSMANLDVASFPHLPSGCALSLSVSRHCCDVHLVSLGRGLGEDLKRTAAAIAVVERCGGLDYESASIEIDIEETKHMEQVLLATMPLLRCCRSMTLDGFEVGCTLLATAGQGARIEELSLGPRCIVDPDVWGAVTSSLPLLSTLLVYTD